MKEQYPMTKISYTSTKKALLFKDTVTVWNELKKTYSTFFKELVFCLPDESEILKSLLFLSKRVNGIRMGCQKVIILRITSLKGYFFAVMPKTFSTIP